MEHGVTNDGCSVFGVEVEPLDDGCVAMECFVIVKAMDSAGDVNWYTTQSDGLNETELLGALRRETILLEDEMVRTVRLEED